MRITELGTRGTLLFVAAPNEVVAISRVRAQNPFMSLITAKDLAAKVAKHNEEALADIPALVGARLADGVASVCCRIQQGEGRCYSGHIKGKVDECWSLARRTIILRPPSDLQTPTATEGNTNRGSANAVAVLTVIDAATEQLGQPLPVVLCIGSNYSQGADYLNADVRLFDDTKMRAGVRRSVELACSHTGRAIRDHAALSFLRDEFHVVAANAFPWITCVPWTELELNQIEAAMLSWCFGYRDPAGRLLELSRSIQPDAVIFHGAHGLAPMTGVEILRRGGKSVDTPYFFCDNLTRVFANSVTLEPFPMEADETSAITE